MWSTIAYVALVVLCLVSGAKEYYAVGFYPALFAAGGRRLDPALARRAPRVAFAGLAVVSVLVGATIAFPIIPESDVGDSPVAAINEDALETIGWPGFVDWVAEHWHRLPDDTVIFTVNYGEAGAVNQFRASRALPRAYSGHNSFISFGRPPDGARPVLVVGYPLAMARHDFRGCRPISRYDNGVDVDNEEQGTPLVLCSGPRTSWRALWPRLHHLNAERCAGDRLDSRRGSPSR